MTLELHHRRLRESRGAVLRGVWVAAALVGGLAGAVALQVAGAGLEQRVAGLAGRPPGTWGAVHAVAACPAGKPGATGDLGPSGTAGAKDDRSAGAHAKGRAVASSRSGLMPAI